MDKKALGLIETYGYVSAIEASDIALKTASVNLEGIEFVKGGIVTVKLVGDVAAVKASIEGGVAAAKKLGTVLSSHVIARLSEDVHEIFLKESTTEEFNEKPSLEINEDLVRKEELESEEKNKAANNIPYKKTKEELLSMKVVKLRNLARKLDDIGIERNEIKFANKKQLVDAIFGYYERKMR